MSGIKISARRPRKKRFLRNILSAAVAAAIVFSAVVWLTLPDVSGLKMKNPETTSLIRRRLAQAGRKSKGPVHLDWIAFDRIPPLLKKCILVS